jgi:hypothetical protein
MKFSITRQEKGDLLIKFSEGKKRNHDITDK